MASAAVAAGEEAARTNCEDSGYRMSMIGGLPEELLSAALTAVGSGALTESAREPGWDLPQSRSRTIFNAKTSQSLQFSWNQCIILPGFSFFLDQNI